MTTIETNALSLTVSRTIAAPPEAVFDAWLDPLMLVQFMNPGPGNSCTHAETDPVEGGRYQINMRAGDQDIPHAGTYQKIDRPHQLIFTWESPFSAEGSAVTLDFEPDGAGTLVTLTHRRFVSEESRDNHNNGWHDILICLEKLL